MAREKSSSVRATNETPLGKVTNLFTNKTTTGASAVKQPVCSKWAILIRGITTGTVLVEASVDGTNFVTIATKTADGVHENSVPYPFVRITCSVATSVALFADLIE